MRIKKAENELWANVRGNSFWWKDGAVYFSEDVCDKVKNKECAITYGSDSDYIDVNIKKEVL